MLQQLLHEVLGHGFIVKMVNNGPFLGSHGSQKFFSHKIPLSMLCAGTITFSQMTNGAVNTIMPIVAIAH